MNETVKREMEHFLGANSEQSAKFQRYLELLKKYNEVMDLTAITAEDEIWEKHFWDSISLGRFVDFTGKSLIDVGTGAGFPGLPLKIAHPSLRVTLLDALSKRVGFLEEVCHTLSLTDISAVHGRAEEYAKLPDVRESFDFATSRALARLNMLCELALPFVKVGGQFLAMKAEGAEEEIKEAENAIALLGGKIVAEHSYTLPITNVTRRVIVIEKIHATPEKYPRRFARIQKKPL